MILPSENGGFKKVRTIEVTSIQSDKSFLYNSSSPLDLVYYDEVFMYVQWYVNGSWSAWGNGAITPLALIKDGTMPSINLSGGFKLDATNITEYYITVRGDIEPYFWAQFISGSYTPTKARILIYVR